MATKEELAQDIYGESFVDLTSGQKAAVTREFNAQDEDDTDEYDEPTAGYVNVTIGRVDDNGTTACKLTAGKCIADLLVQAKMTISDKEVILADSDGHEVTLSEVLDDDESYTISLRVKSN